MVSGFVGAVALATSTYNVYLQRQQVRAQVWPFLVLGADYGNEGFSVSLTNRGVGPAEVKRVRVTVDGKRAGDWVEVEASLLRAASLHDSWQIQPIENEVVSPGLQIVTLKVHDMDHARAMVAERRRLAVELCYCSTLDDCWLLSAPNLFEPSTTRPIAECAPDPKPFRSAGAQLLDNLAAGQTQDPEGGAPDGG